MQGGARGLVAAGSCKSAGPGRVGSKQTCSCIDASFQLPEERTTYVGCSVSRVYFTDKLGSYWATVLFLPVWMTSLRTLVALLVGAYNGWEPITLSSGLATAAFVCVLTAIDAPLPCAPPALRSEVRTSTVHLPVPCTRCMRPSVSVSA